ncbi:MAG: T9SS type A sorting domain-containing protein [Bacteroidia bacterium]|nr:T9SS type A sorting domain-containing protein [Bacteroidia bacterium]
MNNKVYVAIFAFILIYFSGKINAQISFTNGLGLVYVQDFNSLLNTGTSSVFPAGWAMAESGTNANTTYAADNGATGTGNTYSYGTTGLTERALGEVASGSLISTFGAGFVNNTDSTVVRLDISFYTELWRKGALGSKDSAIFEYSTDATSLTTGTWQPVQSLNLITPNLSAPVGAVDGDLVTNRALVSSQVTGISVAVGATIWIRYRAVNVSGNDDGLAVDDFSVTAVKGAPVLIPANISFTKNDLTVNEAAGTATAYLKITGSNTQPSSVQLNVSSYSTLQTVSDYTVSSTTITFPANSANNDSLPFTISLVDDALVESSEHLILTMTNFVNAAQTGITQHTMNITDNDYVVPTGTNELSVSLLGSFSNGVSGSNSAEIVAFDAGSKRLFIANSIGAKLDIVNFTNPSAPVLFGSFPISAYGNINSVAVKNGIVAAAIENSSNPQDSGKIVFFDVSGNYISQVKAGKMPDMITFNHAGTKVYTANEGEPNTAYTNDPDGSITVVDISGGVASVNQSNVTHITFTSFNGQEAALRATGIRIYGLGASASQDFEPEYITISDDDLTAWVALQENNAFAKLDLVTNTITQLMPLGFKDYSVGQNAFDGSDISSAVNIANWPVKGMYLPDGLTSYTSGGNVYLLTANEGDSRAYSGFSEEVRLNTVTLDPIAYPNSAELKNNYAIGKLNVTNKLGDTDNDGDIDQIYAYGSRSFSVWNATSGALTYDSGSELEQITNAHPLYANMFNASNGTAAIKKNRSDDKGPEPEGVVVGAINGNNYAFLALERVGGLMMYNINNPASPYYVGYHNNRPTDLGAEGIVFIDAAQSPNGKNIVILANEISSTLSIYQVDACSATLNYSVTASGPLTICQGDSVKLDAVGNVSNTYQWLLNGSPISGATDTLLKVTAAGNYSLIISKGGALCSDTSSSSTVVVNALPNVNVVSNNPTICNGSSATLTASGASTYLWNNGSTTASLFVFPSSTTTYTVTGTAANGCKKAATVTQTVNALPTVTVSATNSSVCAGGSSTLNAGGASTYSWNTGGTTSSIVVSPASSASYAVTGTGSNGCINSASISITVNQLPAIAISSSSSSVCVGNSATLTATGGSTYLWNTTATTSTLSVSPTTATSYSVTGTDINGCVNTSSVTVAVNQLPVITISASTNTVCDGSPATLTAGGGVSYLWNTTATTSTLSVSPSSATTYSLTGTDANGCVNTSSASIAVNSLPTVSFSLIQNAICVNDGIQNLSASPSGGVFSGTGVSGTNFDPSASGNGTFAINYLYTDVNGCSNSAADNMTVNTCASLEQVSSAANGIRVFPNPNNGNFTFSSENEGETTLELFDVAGKLVFNLKTRNKTEFINVENLADGMYQLRITNNNNIASQRIVVAK